MPGRRKRYVLREATQVGALISPFRHHLMRTLCSIGPATVRELGEHLGRSPESLYYHLRELERVGLVEDQNADVDGDMDAVYDAPARSIVTDKHATDEPYLKAYQKSASALLRLADRQFGRAVERQRELQVKRPLSLRIQQLQVHLDRAAARQLAAKLDELAEFLSEHDRGDGPEAVAVTIVSAPLE